MAASITGFAATIASLKSQRATIKLRIHLAEADPRDGLGKQWEHLQVTRIPWVGRHKRRRRGIGRGAALGRRN